MKLTFGLVICTAIVITTSISMASYWHTNKNGTARYRDCIVRSGPECEEYGMVHKEETAIRTALRGLPEGLLWGSFGGFFVALLLDRVGILKDDEGSEQEKP